MARLKTRAALLNLWARLLAPRDGIDRALARIDERKNKPARKLGYSLLRNPPAAEIGRLVLGMLGARERRLSGMSSLSRDAFAGVSNGMLARYALPEAAAAFAASDPDRARALLQAGRKRWRETGPRLSKARRLSLAATSAVLGDAKGVEIFATGLSGLEVDALKRRFAAQRRTARKLGVKADYASIRKAALSVSSRGGQATLVEALNPDFPLAAATEEPVWLIVDGSFGEQAYPGHLYAQARRQAPVDFPFPGNVRPLFVALHIADPEILNDETLKYLRRFAPIGCRDLLTARLLRGAGVATFFADSRDRVADKGLFVPQPVLDAIREGQSAAKVYALWRKATAPATTRTDAAVAEQNARYPFAEARKRKLALDRVPVRSFGAAPSTSTFAPVHLLFGTDGNLAEQFSGTFAGVWRHATRPLVVHMLGRGLTAAMFERWAARFPGVRFIHYDLSDFAYGDVQLASHITIVSMDRLLAPALLPDLERILWLDMDILVRKDVSPLFDMALGKAPFAARRDPHRDVGVGARQPFVHTLEGRFTEEKWEAVCNAFFSGGPTVYDGFNSGVLVMNLAAMRRDRAVEKLLSLVRACGMDDQVALNLYARTRWKPLAREWNHFPLLELVEDPAVVHFAGIPKPWAAGWSVGFWKDWKEDAARAQARL